MSRGGPLPPVLRPLAGLAERVYRAEAGRRSRRFDAGRGVVTIDRPVISVGNLSVGGTGKTPVVGSVVSWLLEAGHRPAIAMRGYRSRGGESDEAREYLERFGDEVPVVAQADRLSGLFRLFAGESDAGERGRAVDVVVLDDGFQHRRIARQMDIVLLDATRDVFADRCLPAGWLREPVGALARATDVVVTRAEAVEAVVVGAIGEGVERVTGRRPVCEARHRWASLRVVDGGEERGESVPWLRGRRVLACCAIGNPGAFVAACERETGRDVERLVLRDHDHYGDETVRRVMRMAEGCGAVVTTEKDWVKLRRVPAAVWPCPVVRPVLAIGFGDGGERLRGRVLETAGGEVG